VNANAGSKIHGDATLPPYTYNALSLGSAAPRRSSSRTLHRAPNKLTEPGLKCVLVHRASGIEEGRVRARLGVVRAAKQALAAARGAHKSERERVGGRRAGRGRLRASGDRDALRDDALVECFALADKDDVALDKVRIDGLERGQEDVAVGTGSGRARMRAIKAGAGSVRTERRPSRRQAWRPRIRSCSRRAPWRLR